MKRLSGYGIFTAGLSTTGGFFFALMSAMILYLLDLLLRSRTRQDSCDLTYESILLFRDKKEILDFIRNSRYPENKSFLNDADRKNGLILSGAILFFSVTFAYAYSSILPLSALLSILLIPEWR